MNDKISSIRVMKETLYQFNVSKINNRFSSADDFILYLLSFINLDSKTIVINRKI